MVYTIKTQFFFLALLVILGTLTSQAESRSLKESSTLETFEQWMTRHGRAYVDIAEKEKRLQIFKTNVEYIESFNKGANNSYKLGLNIFADLTNEEFKLRNKFKSRVDSNAVTPGLKYENVNDVPATLDWREKGAVTAVKNQENCGCCWAFATVAAMEGITQLTTGTLVSMSEQQLVDCDTSNDGCGGGSMDDAFEYIVQNNGLTTETNYPYEGTAGTCNVNKEANTAAKITGYENVPANSESALLNAVANQPVSVAIDGSGNAFRYYSSGVFDGPCGTNLDHAVTAIGYGIDDDGTKYWLVKNSWGTSWGEQGYMRLKRDIEAPEGLCGIAMQASYPTA